MLGLNKNPGISPGASCELIFHDRLRDTDPPNGGELIKANYWGD